MEALRQLPSYGWDEYLFPPGHGNVRFTGRSVHRWEMRNSFKAACARAGKEFEGLPIHNLRHMATTILFLRGIPGAAIRKLTGHRSREWERYEHLSPHFRQRTVELIANELTGAGDTPTGTPPSERVVPKAEVVERNGGDDGARTRDLRRDRPAF